MDKSFLGGVLGAVAIEIAKPTLKVAGEWVAEKVGGAFQRNILNMFEKTDKIVEETTSKPITEEQIRKIVESEVGLKLIDVVRIKSDEYIQQLLARIMASEIMEEGTYSLETIHRLSLMTRKELEYFYENIAPFWFGGNGFFQLTAEVEVNALISDLDVVKYGLSKGFKKFDSSDEQWYSTDFSNGDKFLIQGKNVSKMNLKIAVLNRFGHDLCKIGVAENKIRKWTPEDKREILRVCKQCGIDEIDVKFDV